MKTFPIIICMMILVLSAQASCIESGSDFYNRCSHADNRCSDVVKSYLALDTGYRWDRISNRATLGGTSLLRGSTQKLGAINSYQLGAKGLWNFCGCAYVKGEGHYGWVGGGNYSEGGFFGNATGNTYDGKGALGYYFQVARAIRAAPVIGYSYDALNLRGTDIHVEINGVDYHLTDIKANQRFRGPFIGFDVIYKANERIDFILGYEFHFAEWNGDRLIQGAEYGNSPLFGLTTAFSNKRHVSTVYGQVVNLDLGYTFCDCWRIGLDLKYQFYYGYSGTYKQTETPILPLVFYAKVNDLKWLSFASTITIQKNF